MSRRQAGIASIALVVVIALAAVAWYAIWPSHRLKNASEAPAVSKAQVGQPAPPFAVSTTGGPFDLTTSDKPVFLEIFATWCPHCQRETAVIDRLYQNFKARVDFVGVSGSDTAIDGTTAASQLDVLKWAKRFNVQYPVAYDASLGVAGSYLQGAFPTLVIIDGARNVAYLNTGEVSYDDLAAALAKVLPH
ncbi:MAG TPA: TlpA disulfide reductase family protein [Candidatus Tumulicola sp.]|jgi:thiol-disulfide isomerase/thioredoxin